MPGPKMLSDANRRLVFIPTLADYHKPDTAELTAGTDLSCIITKADFQLGATGNEEISEPEWCADIVTTAPGAATYEAGMNFFRYKETADDLGWSTFTDKGIVGYLVQRIGQAPDGVKNHEHPWTDADEVQVYQVITGTQQILAPEQATYEKFRQMFYVQTQVDERAVVATAVA